MTWKDVRKKKKKKKKKRLTDKWITQDDDDETTPTTMLTKGRLRKGLEDEDLRSDLKRNRSQEEEEHNNPVGRYTSSSSINNNSNNNSNNNNNKHYRPYKASPPPLSLFIWSLPSPSVHSPSSPPHGASFTASLTAFHQHGLNMFAITMWVSKFKWQ